MWKKIFEWSHDIFCILSANFKMVISGALLSSLIKGEISPQYYVLLAFIVIDGLINIWESTRYV